MSITTEQPLQSVSTPIPPLEPGDHLTRAEFERRYNAMPHLKKAELIEGIVYMPSPVRWDRHANPHADLIGWMWTYSVYTPGVEGGDNATIRLDMENDPQPDGVLIVTPEYGGTVRKSEDGCIEGAPDLVGEVSASSASFDLHTKFRVFRRNGVREYIVWRVNDKAVDWFALRDGDFVALAPNALGRIESTVFPGLWLDVKALVQFDRATVLKVLQEGIASPAHAAFVQQLQAR